MKSSAQKFDDLFRTIHVINLDRRGDRWADLASRLAVIKPDVILRYTAVDGHSLGVEDCAQLSLRAKVQITRDPVDHRDLTPGGAGCSLSHLRLWRHFLTESSAPFLTVLEDDATPIVTGINNLAQWITIRASIPTDVDLLLLGGNVLLRTRLSESVPVSRVFYFNGTFAYVITRTGATQLLKHMPRVRTLIDHDISDVLVRNPHTVRAYSIDKAWFDHLWASPSDIPSPHDCKRADARFRRYLGICHRVLSIRHGINTEIIGE